jgi:hypothetical protein
MNKQVLQRLIILTILIFALKLFFAFSQTGFTYDSYFHLRQVESITQTGIPLFQDSLSYGGRAHLFLPAFHYLAAIFAFIFPLELVAKVLPNLLLSLLVPIAFVTIDKITNNKQAAFLSAIIAGLLPSLFHTNSFTPSSLFFPLIFIAIYGFMTLNRMPFIYILAFIVLCFTHAATALLLIGFLIYLGLSLLERKKITRKEVEIMLFSLFFYVWSQFLFFKNILLSEGMSFIYQNVPPQIIQVYFPPFSIANSLLLVGIIPFVAGVIVVYKSLFYVKGKRIFFLISLAISTASLSWFSILPSRESLTFFGLILSLLFAQFFLEILEYMSKTKLARYKNILFSLFAILLIVTMIPFAISEAQEQNIPTDIEIESFKWLNNNTPEDSIVLALLEEGHMVTYYGKRKNVMDTEFGFIKNVDDKFNDVSILYNTPFHTEATDKISKNNIDYLMFTVKAKEKYQIGTFKYHTPSCFTKVYKNEVKIYSNKCILVEVDDE